MQHQLYPSEILEQTTESYLPQVTVRSQLIYTTIVLAILAALAALPFIRVTVSVQSTGLIRPAAEKNELKSLVAGTISKVWVKENQLVKAGQTLFTLQTDALDTKLQFNRIQQAEKQSQIADLSKLVNMDKQAPLRVQGLSSPLYRQQYAQFVFHLSEKMDSQQKKKRDLEISQRLYTDKVIAERELEEKEFEFSISHTHYLTLLEQQLSQWQSDLTTHTMTLTQLQAEEKQLVKEKELYSIQAPFAGSLGQLSGKYASSYVQAGEVLGVISPDSNLVVECYMAPKDIGQIQAGMKATFQVDAFDYNQWGTISGAITEVFNDVIVVNEQPVFKVKCHLAQPYLTLPNGYQGTLKKGMTVRARFMVAERSLFQLLYDQADDWMNPTQE